ncbi:hypothetical protein [Nitrosopumilus zosterae]|uniref:hypothetical protein n=1 Tax=Nitrosopumilus zosterae TaxID=718286 RepID=UPI0011B216C7|nr:hypothetical protein [Nitrosopumilus zosterae]BDQ31495.1 hypothetical protein NZOSNM25_001615 [Nitrosopumilus zosterae]
MSTKLILIVCSILFVVSFSPVHAQHHSGSLAPPIDFDGLKVALTTILFPEDFTSDDSNNANLSIRFFDSETNANIKSVTYRVEIFHENNLVANEYFFDEDGKLDLEIKPKTGCQEKELWKCTKYYGEKHAIAGAYYARGDSFPVIQGPVFDKSGQYNIKVSIVGATNPKTMTTKDLLFETFVSIPQKEIFLIKTANAQEYPVSIKSYNSKISNFNYDELADKISYEIHLDNEHAMQHDFISRHAVILQKDFSSFKQGYDLNVFVQGIKLEDDSIEFDISSPDQNIIRTNITHDELMQIEDKAGISNPLKVEILSGDKKVFSERNFIFENGFSANVSWDSNSDVGKKIPFTFSFFDAINKPVNEVLFAYSITDSAGKEIWSNIGTGGKYLGVLAPHGISQESILIPTQGQYKIKLILTGQNSKNFAEFLTSTADFKIGQPSMQQKTDGVPSWIKNNAGWWSNGIVGDQEFVQSIQFLMKEKILNIPATKTNPSESQEIPTWVKNNAGWWSQDLISERDFVKGIEFLVNQGIITVN